MEITGLVLKVGETQVISEKFSKREMVLEIQGDYPQPIIMEATQDKCSILDKVKVGYTVTAHINLRGREWTNPNTGEVRYFNTLQVWKVDVTEGVETREVIDMNVTGPIDDLPFQ